MKLFQKKSLNEVNSSLLRVNNDTFAELLDQTGDFYKFNLNFKLAVSSGKKSISDYDKVVITIKSKEPEYSSLTDKDSNYTSSNILKQDNLSSPKNLLSLVKPNNGLLTSKVTAKVGNKLYSGLKAIKDLQTKEDFIERVEVSIANYAQDAIGHKYNYTELFSSNYKPSTSDARKRNVDLKNNSSDFLNQVSTINQESSKIDPASLLSRINDELCDVTLPVSDPILSKLSSESQIDDPSFRLRELSRGKTPLYYDIIRFFLNDIPGSPKETSDVWYQSRRVTKFLSEISINQIVTIKKNNKNKSLIVRFDLYKRNTNIIDETLSFDLHTSSHVEAFNCSTKPPVVSVANLSGQIYKNLTIDDAESDNKIDSFNVYVKNIDSRGIPSEYEKIANVKNKKSNTISFVATGKLAVVRVIPVDLQGNESAIYTSIICGEGHDALGNLTILPGHYGKNQIRVEVLNVPKETVVVSLFKRECSENIDNVYTKVSDVKLGGDNINVDIIDNDVTIGKVYEYYATALSVMSDNKQEKLFVSNYVIFKNIPSAVLQKAIDVTLKNIDNKQATNGFMISFELKTEISKTENEKITKVLKDQIGELYDQYLNPSNNTSSPLGETRGVPDYSDLFFHEVVRTNLNTSERETFDLVSDGIFEDSSETQKISNVSPINPLHTYQYQVFTYKKNPIELFKKFVAWGVNSRGREWFYLPYKWRNPKVKLGKLYPEDASGVPVIDGYDNFTSEAFGVTSSYQFAGGKNYTSLTQLKSERIDRNTIKISWGYANQELYDSFVVLKVVNGQRGFVGRCHKNYIYHELTENDIGSIYYIVVPIMHNFDIDAPEYTDSIFVSTDGLTSIIKLSQNGAEIMSSAQQSSKDILQSQRSIEQLTQIKLRS